MGVSGKLLFTFFLILEGDFGGEFSWVRSGKFVKFDPIRPFSRTIWTTSVDWAACVVTLSSGCRQNRPPSRPAYDQFLTVLLLKRSRLISKSLLWKTWWKHDFIRFVMVCLDVADWDTLLDQPARKIIVSRRRNTVFFEIRVFEDLASGQNCEKDLCFHMFYTKSFKKQCVFLLFWRNYN